MAATFRCPSKRTHYHDSTGCHFDVTGRVVNKTLPAPRLTERVLDSAKISLPAIELMAELEKAGRKAR